MAPNPEKNPVDIEEKKYCRIFPENDDDQIVVTGISGHFPKSKNLTEYEYNLFNKIDMVSEGAFGYVTEFDVPNRIGKVYDEEKFDSTFFGVHYKQALSMDPQCRIMIETAYEAAIDAGINPKTLRGSRTGVFVGTSYSDSEKAFFYDINAPGNFGITGCSRAMLANRISFTLGLTGPSFLVDGAGSTTLQGLDIAYEYLRNGSIDAAIIGGANIILYPQIDVQFNNIGVIAKDGYTRPFDKNSSGYNRSEAISCLFLQKKCNAKRIYGYVLHSKSNNDGYRPEGVTYFSPVMKENLLREFYKESKINPKDIGYIEANGTGIPIEDTEECKLIDRVLCKERHSPLLIGSVKSNLGYADAAAGVTALVKVCLALQNCKIPPNINFSEPRPEISALIEGRLKVVTEVENLISPLIAINSFNYYGENCHAVLKAYEKDKINFGVPNDSLPRLVCWSGRTEEAVNFVLDYITNKPLDAELIGLIHEIQKESIPSLVFRGYGLFGKDPTDKAECIVKEVQHYTGIKRPIVWVFSGMGSQWTEMGTSLMEIPIFNESIQICHKALLDKKINLIEILTSKDKTIYDNILHSFVGIAAIQVGLVDILRALNLEPDYLIGHSVGELGCGYADGGFTREQMMLAAYSRGKVSVETEKIRGSMAAIGMGFKSITKLLPNTIEVACHNSSESCTISGPAEDVTKFVDELKAQNVFAKEVPCSNIAYHSRYISQMGPQLLKYLKEIIPNPIPRSTKWLCSSVPKSNWNDPESNYCSAEYHTNNLLNSVLFEETAILLPPDALTIEIAPHGLLQAILKRSMLKAIHIGLTQRGHKNNDQYLIQALGKIYLNGVDMPIGRIYPKIDFPVSRGTPNLSSLVKWDHNDDWEVLKYISVKLDKSSERSIELSLHQENLEYLKQHMVDGRVLVPASYLLQFVLESFAAIKSTELMEISVQFEDIKFVRYLYLEENNSIPLNVMIHRGTGNFSITENEIDVVTGLIKIIEEPIVIQKLTPTKTSDLINLSGCDFYKALKIKGYEFGEFYKSVQEVRDDATIGKIKWNKNFSAFLEALFQINYFKANIKTALYPKQIRKITFLAKDHINNLSEDNCVDFNLSEVFNTIVSGSLEIVGLQLQNTEKVKFLHNPTLNSNKFISHFPSPLLSLTNVVRCCLQLANECLPKPKMKIVELNSKNNIPIISIFSTVLNEIPLLSGKCIFLSNNNKNMPGILTQNIELANVSNCTFVIAVGALSNVLLATQAEKSLNEASFLISREKVNLNLKIIKAPQGFQIIGVFQTEFENFVLLQKRYDMLWKKPVAIKISDSDVNWIRDVQNVLTKGPLVLYAENERCNGILGMCQSLRKGKNGNLITSVLIDDARAPCFSLDDPFYIKQLKLGLPINILKDGKWGTYRQLDLSEAYALKSEIEDFYCDIVEPGDITTLNWYQGNLLPNKSDIKVTYSSLNFQDVLLATGHLPLNNYSDNQLEEKHLLGMEFSGVETKTGKRVMGISTNNGLSSYLNTNTPLLWNIPSDWSFQDAATVPVAYSLVYYALFQIASIRNGKTILIHCGAGGVGLAAIRVALAYGLNVFTTVSNSQKKKFLIDTFPQLKEGQIGSSVDTTFEEMIQEHTKNIGVDYILNSLSEDKLITSVRCLAKNGIFIEIGKFDMTIDNKIGFGIFLKEVSFRVANLYGFLSAGTKEKLLELRNMISRDIASGIIQPLKATVFKAHEIQQAFRYFSSRRHVGKILVEIRNDSKSTYSNPIHMIPRIHFDPKLVYIVSDSFKEFGLEYVGWMVSRGAKKIILHSSNSISEPYQLYKIGKWKNYGVNITFSSHDITTRQGCETLLLYASTQLGSVGGIFNLNGFSEIDIVDSETLTTNMQIKVDATKHLDDLSRQLCSKLDHFVVMTNLYAQSDHSVQTINNMTNSMVERIIENRVFESFPGKVLVWGDIQSYEVNDKIDVSKNGHLQQSINSCLEQLDKMLSASEALVSCTIINKKATDEEKNILNVIAKIIGIADIKSCDISLTDLGLNSLGALEVNHFLKNNYRLNFSLEQLKLLSLEKLYKMSCEYYQETKKGDELNATTHVEGTGIAALLYNFGKQRIVTKNIVHNLESNSIDKSSQLLFIPGIEGSAEVSISDLAHKLHSKLKTIQLNESINTLSIKDIAQSVFSTVRNVLKKGEKFYLVGYSFGALVTLELALLLEKLKYSGNILLIDGAPHFLNELITQNLGKSFTDEDLYNEIFVALSKQIPYVSAARETLLDDFKILKTFESKIKKLMEFAKNHPIYTQEYVEIMVRIVFNRIRMIGVTMENDTEQQLSSPITLVRPKEVSVEDIEEDYKLSKLTKGKVVVQYVNGNHITIMENSNLASVINYFDPAKDEKKNFENYLNSGCVLEKDFI